MQAEFKNVRTEMQGEFKSVRAEIDTVRTEIKTEGQTTRRHFDIMVEKVNESVRLVAEATAHNTSRLADHERGLTTLEKPRRS
jgi:phage protein U